MHVIKIQEQKNIIIETTSPTLIPSLWDKVEEITIETKLENF
jgi:hypothetical protein